MKRKLIGVLAVTAVGLLACGQPKTTKDNPATQHDSTLANDPDLKDKTDELPLPYATESARKNSRVIGWPADKTPIAPLGFTVTRFADKMNNPRWIYLGPNGDIFVSQAQTRGAGANSVILLRDTNNDGTPDVRETFLSGLNRPFGMLILNNFFYVANTDGVYRYPYTTGQTKIEGEGQKILELPAGGYNNHWTRNLIANADGSKIYVSVGSGSNVGEHGIENEVRRANILEINPDGTGERVYAYGLRKPGRYGLAARH